MSWLHCQGGLGQNTPAWGRVAEDLWINSECPVASICVWQDILIKILFQTRREEWRATFNTFSQTFSNTEQGMSAPQPQIDGELYQVMDVEAIERVGYSLTLWSFNVRRVPFQ